MISATHRKRIWLIAILIIGSTLSAGLILWAFSNNIDLYYTPTDYQSLPNSYPKIIRVGGMVVKGSVKRESELKIQFNITDYEKELTIVYEGILPDLFKEGQGVVVLGKKQNQNQLIATQVLAKHDEKYMPPEIARRIQTKNSIPSGDV